MMRVQLASARLGCGASTARRVPSEVRGRAAVELPSRRVGEGGQGRLARAQQVAAEQAQSCSNHKRVACIVRLREATHAATVSWRKTLLHGSISINVVR